MTDKPWDSTTIDMVVITIWTTNKNENTMTRRHMVLKPATDHSFATVTTDAKYSEHYTGTFVERLPSGTVDVSLQCKDFIVEGKTETNPIPQPEGET